MVHFHCVILSYSTNLLEISAISRQLHIKNVNVLTDNLWSFDCINLLVALLVTLLKNEMQVEAYLLALSTTKTIE